MKSRVGKKLYEYLKSGEGAVLHKYSLAKLAPCDERTAYAALKQFHKKRRIFICAWHKVPFAKIPVYSLGRLPDAPKPAPLTREQINKNRLKNTAYMEREKMRKRKMREKNAQSSNEQ